MINKIFKIVLLLSLCVGITISTNAAVSVSDGSAFITKSEFDADINNLSNRMAYLENSLDSKIDNLVSSYLTRNGIWSGEEQQVLNNLGIECFTDSSKRIFENITKTGLMLLPYYIKIDFHVGVCHSKSPDSSDSSTYQRAMASPVFYIYSIMLNIYNESSLESYQSSSLLYTPCGEYDTANNLVYAMRIDKEPSGVFAFFVQKGDNIAYSLSSSLRARMDWWAMESDLVTGNEQTLSGDSIQNPSGTRKGKWINGSYYKTYFGIDGTKISVY